MRYCKQLGFFTEERLLFHINPGNVKVHCNPFKEWWCASYQWIMICPYLISTFIRYCHRISIANLNRSVAAGNEVYILWSTIYVGKLRCFINLASLIWPLFCWADGQRFIAHEILVLYALSSFFILCLVASSRLAASINALVSNPLLFFFENIAGLSYNFHLVLWSCWTNLTCFLV